MYRYCGFDLRSRNVPPTRGFLARGISSPVGHPRLQIIIVAGAVVEYGLGVERLIHLSWHRISIVLAHAQTCACAGKPCRDTLTPS